MTGSSLRLTFGHIGSFSWIHLIHRKEAHYDKQTATPLGNHVNDVICFTYMESDIFFLNELVLLPNSRILRYPPDL